MQELRQAQRIRTFKGGSILFGNEPTVECLIRNLSETGACLEIGNPSSPALVPDSFALIIKPENLKRDCRVMWRSDRRVGVLFNEA
jgi:hypothetical protein